MLQKPGGQTFPQTSESPSKFPLCALTHSYSPAHVEIDVFVISITFHGILGDVLNIRERRQNKMKKEKRKGEDRREERKKTKDGRWMDE